MKSSEGVGERNCLWLRQIGTYRQHWLNEKHQIENINPKIWIKSHPMI